MQQTDVPRFDLCPVCDIEDLPGKTIWYTREEVVTHIQKKHPWWALCKGCGELMTKRESGEGKGWCELCVILCYDCMDEEKYGPPEPLDFPSASTVTEVTNPEPEDPGPPPNYDWLTPVLYKGRSPKPSLIEKIVSGVRTVHGLFLVQVDRARKLFR